KGEKKKEQWDRPAEFVLSLISNSVGLGNVWRFPYLAYKSGGGAFLIPYFTLYILIGLPLYYLELALGQFSSQGPPRNFVLHKSNGFHEFGTPVRWITLCLLLAWIIIACCIIRGVKSTGKVVYFTAIFPYIVLLILLIRAATFEGAVTGIKYYVTPDWSKVRDFQVWRDAAGQVFFSLSVGFGALVAYSSSNKFKNNFFYQCVLVVSCDCLTGVFAGFTVFATIGFLAVKLKGGDIERAAAGGPGLAFVVYPEALSQMPAAPVFSILFFLMLLALGLGSQFGGADVIVTAILQFYPKLKRWMVVITVCAVSFLLSLPFVCNMTTTKGEMTETDETPRYILAFRLTNSPDTHWGPEDNENRTGARYPQILQPPVTAPYELVIGVQNPTFQTDF
ncbi:unnamed protein product, partial [Didymodactylos carnosus]